MGHGRLNAEADREVRDYATNEVLLRYSGGDVPRRGDPMYLLSHNHDGTERGEAVYEVVAVYWRASSWNTRSGYVFEGEFKPSLPLAVIQVAKRPT